MTRQDTATDALHMWHEARARRRRESMLAFLNDATACACLCLLIGAALMIPGVK